MLSLPALIPHKNRVLVYVTKLVTWQKRRHLLHPTKLTSRNQEVMEGGWDGQMWCSSHRTKMKLERAGMDSFQIESSKSPQSCLDEDAK